MILRLWTGLARPALADAYVEHLRSETFPALTSMPGFVDASILRRNVPQGVEFVVVSRWASIDAVRAFAGADVDAAVVPQKVRDMMVDWDRVARHYEVVE